MDTKECSRCHVVRSVDEFHNKPSTKSGLDSYCKRCRKHHTSIRKFNNIKKASRGYNLDLIETVAKEMNLPLDKVKEVIVAQSVATKQFMTKGFIIKWIYVGKFCPKVASMKRGYRRKVKFSKKNA